jgi:hypothetical protein
MWSIIMLRFYLRLSILFIALFSLIGAAAMALGSTQPIHPALRGFIEGCEGVPQPCWYGIVLDPETIDTAEMVNIELLLRNLGFEISSGTGFGEAVITAAPLQSHQCQIDISIITPQNQVYLIEFSSCPHILLGDVLWLFGNPDRIDICHNGSDEPTMIYTASRIEITFSASTPISLFSQVLRIAFSTSGFILGSYPYADSWHGFAPLWFYNRLEPNIAGC